MGAANCSGNLSMHGFSKEEWQAWVAANPERLEPKDYKYVGNENGEN
jgi:hypothetical protein